MNQTVNQSPGAGTSSDVAPRLTFHIMSHSDRDIRDAEDSFFPLIDFIQSGHTLSVPETDDAVRFLESIAPINWGTGYYSHFLHRSICTPEPLLVLLTSNDPRLENATLHFFRNTLEYTQPFDVFVFTRSNFFSRLPVEFQEKRDHFSPEQSFFFLRTIYQCLKAGEYALTPSQDGTETMSKEDIIQTLVTDLIRPLQPFWRALFSNRFSFKRSPDHFYLTSFLIEMVNLSLYSKKPTDMLSSLPVSLLLTWHLDCLENSNSVDNVFFEVDDCLGLWMSSTEKDTRVLVDAVLCDLDGEGFGDELDQSRHREWESSFEAAERSMGFSVRLGVNSFIY